MINVYDTKKQFLGASYVFSSLIYLIRQGNNNNINWRYAYIPFFREKKKLQKQLKWNHHIINVINIYQCCFIYSNYQLYSPVLLWDVDHVEHTSILLLHLLTNGGGNVTCVSELMNVSFFLFISIMKGLL